MHHFLIGIIERHLLVKIKVSIHSQSSYATPKMQLCLKSLKNNSLSSMITDMLFGVAAYILITHTSTHQSFCICRHVKPSQCLRKQAYHTEATNMNTGRGGGQVWPFPLNLLVNDIAVIEESHYWMVTSHYSHVSWL
jgi:hypothetical protein